MADYTAVPAELTDAIRGISPALGEFASLMENVLPALSSMVPVVGELLEAFEASQPEILAVVEALKFLAPVIEQVGKTLYSTFAPMLTQVAKQFTSEMTPVWMAMADLAKSIVMPLLRSLQPILKQLADGLKLLGAVVTLLLDPLKPLRDALAFLGALCKSAAAAVGDAFAALGRSIASMASLLYQSFAKLSTLLVDFAARAARAFASFSEGLIRVASDLIRSSISMQGANALMSLAAGGIQAFTSSMTAGISSLVSAVTPFVQALSPGVMFGLNYAMRSLQATIGVALVPVAKVLTGALHQLAGVLMPAMQAIGPALGSLAQALMTFVKGTFRVFADTLITLTPLLETLAQAANVLVGTLDAVRAVFLAVADTLLAWVKSLFGGSGDTKSLLASFRDGLHQAIEAILKFTVILAKSLGLSEFQAALAKNLKDLAGERPGERTSGAAPAATDVAFRGFEDFSKSVAQAAFVAQGGAVAGEQERSEREWLAKLAESLEEIKDGKAVQEYFSEFQKWLQGQADAYSGKMGGWVAGKVEIWGEGIIEKSKKEILIGWRKCQIWILAHVVNPILEMIRAAADSIPGSSWFRRR